MSGKRTDRSRAANEPAGNTAASPQFANYGLRSQFFVRKLQELSFLTVASDVRKLLPLRESFRWDHPEKFGVDPAAFKTVTDSGIEPLLFFLHPRVLSEQPPLLLYYRCVAMVSQKGIASITGVNVAAIEEGRGQSASAESARSLVLTVNKLLSLVALSFAQVQSLQEPHLQAFLFAQAGAQIQGSWNNAVGEQGETVIREIVARNLFKEVIQVVWKDNSTVDASETSLPELIAHAGQIKVLRMSGGLHCAFGAEPDVSLRDSSDLPLVSVEVKAGADPAGALERYGAAKKSFDHERGLNPRLKTVYVATCITPEVNRRLQQESPFSHTFLLGEVMTDPRTQTRFANLFLAEITQTNRTT